jgi:hypothetical protein
VCEEGVCARAAKRRGALLAVGVVAVGRRGRLKWLSLSLLSARAPPTQLQATGIIVNT